MPNHAVGEAYLKAREAFARYMQLKAEAGAGRTRALREYVNAHAEYTRLFDASLRRELPGVIPPGPARQLQ